MLLHTKLHQMYLSKIDEIIGYHQCRFPCNISTTDQVFCFCQTLEKNGSVVG
jgi:hypothetical protein